MATHSSILVWKIPWTEEPGGLQSMRGCKESDTTERLTLSLSQWGGWRRADLSLGHFSCSFSFESHNSRWSREELGDWVCCCWVFLVSAPHSNHNPRERVTKKDRQRVLVWSKSLLISTLPQLIRSGVLSFNSSVSQFFDLYS